MIPMIDPRPEIERLYQQYRRPLLAYLARLVEDREAAEDICQETFLKALCRWAQRDEHGNAAAWLYRIATNSAYDHLRRRRRVRFTRLIEAEALDTAHVMEARLAECEPISEALARIPAQYREALLLAWQGHNSREIAEAVGCSYLAVKMRIFRARERFRQLYRPDGPQQDLLY